MLRSYKFRSRFKHWSDPVHVPNQSGALLLEVLITMGLVMVLCLSLSRSVSRLHAKELHRLKLFSEIQGLPLENCAVEALPTWGELLVRCKQAGGTERLTIVSLKARD